MFLLSGIFITESDFELLMRFNGPGVVENNNICQSKINELNHVSRKKKNITVEFCFDLTNRLRGTLKHLNISHKQRDDEFHLPVCENCIDKLNDFSGLIFLLCASIK